MSLLRRSFIAAVALAAASLGLAEATSAQQEFVALHNAKRARHCAPPVAWSPQLAAAAQAYARQCKIGVHDGQRGNQGENLAAGFATPAAVVDAWYNEVSGYDYNRPGFSLPTGHFTQVVWRSTTQIGCALWNCGGQQNWVCRYGPPGNFPNQFPQNVLPPTCAAGQPPPKPTTPGTPPPAPPKPTTPATPPPAPGTTPPAPKPTTPGTPPAPGPKGAGPGGNWSAIAIDGRGRWGYANHFETQQLAQQRAIAACGGAGCRVVLRSGNRCISYAESRSGGYWYGIADGPDQAQVQQAAVRFCQQRAPAGSCRSAGVWCR
jgi:hypothetical protein